MFRRYKYLLIQSFNRLSIPTIGTDYSLKAFNTFGVDVSAKEFAAFRSAEELRSLLDRNADIFLLGGGSNLLLTKDIDQLVLKNQILGIQILERSDNKVLVQCGGGEQWHDLVMWAVALGYGGVENLALIPGCVGTAPIQNIGAYGVELKDVMHSLEAVDLQTKQLETYSAEDCQFGYRDSIFKRKYKGKFCITKVMFELTTSDHKLNLEYGNIKDQLAKKGVDRLTINDVCQTVIAIRQSKLPDPEVIGNSGSFFKNPIVDESTIDTVKKNFPDLRCFEHSDGLYKIPAAWLIDKLGLKGFRKGDAGVYDKHALVLVNHGDASGKEIYDLAMSIITKVKETFGIELIPEVNII